MANYNDDATVWYDMHAVKYIMGVTSLKLIENGNLC
jgi:hypothetical protein